MNRLLLSRLCAAGVLLGGCATVMAQVEKLTPAERQRSPGGGGPGGPMRNGTSVPPSTDPKNFAGTWRMGGGPGGPGGGPGGPGAPGAGGPGGGGPGGGGGAPGGAGGPGGGGAPGGAAPGGGAPGGGPGGAPGGAPGGGGPEGGLPPEALASLNGASAGDILPGGSKSLCLPQAPVTSGVDGPLLLVQTPEQITWASEEMHHIRRIYLTGTFTPNFKPNYEGEAIGHWEGNTLVIETRGLRSQKGGVMMERWTKAADGSSFEDEVSYLDAAGKPVGKPRTSKFSWANGAKVLEWICEDYNELFLPGAKVQQ
ncbi:MAG TPA: hypothetical protein VMI92_13520 [Steroidobacteraceae bacterium]|nr:hypothetical protein [Steroidobacteraceae bacterium]